MERVPRPAAIRGSAPGKVILLGEHAVVYGRAAIAAAIDRRVEVALRPATGSARFDQEDDSRLATALKRAAELVGGPTSDFVATISSDLPRAMGLGSSAALSVALVRALATQAGRRLEVAELSALAFEIETIFHGTPSGIDPAAAALGATCFRFVRGEPPTVTPLRTPRPLPLVVAFGEAPRSTGAAVGGLRARWEADRDAHERLFDAVADVVARGTAALEAGDLRAVGAAFDDNQALLARLGVSSAAIARLTDVARRAGAHGAKLTGGGAGGAVIAVADDPEPVAAALRRDGARVLVVRVGGEGEGV